MSHENNYQRGQLLEFNYAQINMSTGECIATFTSSYQIPSSFEEYVEIPVWTDDYEGKFYNRNDGLWYLDSVFSQVWADAPQW